MELSLLHGGGLVHSKDPHHLTSLWERVEKHSSYLEVWRRSTEAEAGRMEESACQRAGKSIEKGKDTQLNAEFQRITRRDKKAFLN